MNSPVSADEQMECRGCGLFQPRSECLNGTCRRCGCKVQPARLAAQERVDRASLKLREANETLCAAEKEFGEASRALEAFP